MDETIRDVIATKVRALLRTAGNGLNVGELLEDIEEAKDKAALTSVMKVLKDAGEIERTGAGGLWKLATKPAAKKSDVGATVRRAFVDAGGPLSVADVVKATGVNQANVSYHCRALVKAGVLRNGGTRGAYALAGTRQVKSVAPPSTRAQQRKKPVKPHTPAPTASSSRAAAGISLILTCPAGELEIRGTPKLVFGFVGQLEELAGVAA